MNLKNNKGYTGTDILIATLVIMVFLPTIVSLIYNIQKNQNQTERKTYALNLATNVLEIAKSSDITKMNTSDEVTETNNDFYNRLKTTYSLSAEDLTKTGNTITYGTEDANGNQYKIKTAIKDYKDYHVTNKDFINPNIIKKITTTVEYRVGNDTKTIEISTLKTIE